jgi:putative sterol carrier protein
MAVFSDADEIYRYIGGTFQEADRHPDLGPKLRAAGIVLRLDYTDPEATMTVRLQDPITVIEGASDDHPDVTLTVAAEIADRFWRGEYDLAAGLAKGEIKASGPITKILRLVPLTRPLFPIYQELRAAEAAEGGSRTPAEFLSG